MNKLSKIKGLKVLSKDQQLSVKAGNEDWLVEYCRYGNPLGDSLIHWLICPDEGDN